LVATRIGSLAPHRARVADVALLARGVL